MNTETFFAFSVLDKQLWGTAFIGWSGPEVVGVCIRWPELFFNAA